MTAHVTAHVTFAHVVWNTYTHIECAYRCMCDTCIDGQAYLRSMGALLCRYNR